MQDAHVHTDPPQEEARAPELPFIGPIDEIEERVREFDVQARRFVRENPTLAVAGAIALGFVIGKVFR